MEQASDIRERRIQSLARRYRRDGYIVTKPTSGAELPNFLGDHIPDLIVESDDDRAVIQVKHVNALKGANDLVDLARRVEGQSGWRMELVTVAASTTDTLPSVASMKSFESEIAPLVQARFFKAAFICAYAGIERLLRSMAIRNGINPDKVAFAKLIQELGSQGLVPGELISDLKTVSILRNRLVHSDENVSVGQPDISRLLMLGEKLFAELMLEAA